MVESSSPLHLFRLDNDEESAQPLIGWTLSSELLSETSQIEVMPWVILVSEFEGREMDRQVVPLDRGWAAIGCRAVGVNTVHAAVAWASTDKAHRRLGAAITARAKPGELRWSVLEPTYPKQLEAMESFKALERDAQQIRTEIARQEAVLPRRRSSRRSGKRITKRPALNKLRQDLAVAEQAWQDRRAEYWQLCEEEVPSYRLSAKEIDWDGDGEERRSRWDRRFHGQTRLELSISEQAFLPMEKGLAHKLANGIGRRQPKDQCDQRKRAMVGVARSVASAVFWTVATVVAVVVMTAIAAGLWLWGRPGVNILKLPQAIRSDEESMSEWAAPVFGRPSPSRWMTRAVPGEFGTQYIDYPLWRRVLINPAFWLLVGVAVISRQLGDQQGIVVEGILFLVIFVCVGLLLNAAVGRTLDRLMNQRGVGSRERRQLRQERRQQEQQQRLQQQLAALTEGEVRPPDYVLAARAIKGWACKSFAINR